MIAINLPLNNIFVGKKLHGIISEGNVKNYSKKHKIKKDFSNQLTIIVKVPNTFICSTDNIEYDTKANESIKNRKRKYIEDDKEYFNVNLKIFGNGKIIITGCLTKDEVKYAVNTFVNEIKNYKQCYSISDTISIDDLFSDISEYIKYIKKHYIRFYKLFEIYGLNIDLNMDIILNDIKSKQFISLNHKIIDLITIGQSDALHKFVKLIQINNILLCYYPNNIKYKKHIVDSLINSIDKDDTMQIIFKLYNLETIEFPVSYNLDIIINDIIIINHNTKYTLNKYINILSLLEILNTEYIKYLDRPASYSPDSYQGLIVKLLCGETLNKHVTTLLIFTKDILITGVSDWNQINYSINFITELFNKHSELLLNITNICNVNKHYVNKFKLGNNVYVSNTYLINDPRNYMLLKKYNMHHSYM